MRSRTFCSKTVYKATAVGGQTKETILPPPARIRFSIQSGPAGFELSGQCESESGRRVAFCLLRVRPITLGQPLWATAEANDETSCVADHLARQSQQIKAQRLHPLVSQSFPTASAASRHSGYPPSRPAPTMRRWCRTRRVAQQHRHDDRIVCHIPLIRLCCLNLVPNPEGS